MLGKIRKTFIIWVIGILILSFSWQLLKEILYNKNTGSWGLIFITMVTFFTGIGCIIIPFRNTKIGNILLIFFGRIVSLIIRMFNCLEIVIIPVFSIISIWVVQIGIWELINLFYTFNDGKLLAIYFTTLIILLIIAYRGSQLISFFFKLFSSFKLTSSDKSKINLINKVLEVTFLRRRVYEFSIIIMILSSIEKFSNTSIINNLLWVNYSEVSLEVLVTFVAIDTYLQTFKKDINSKIISNTNNMEFNDSNPH